VFGKTDKELGKLNDKLSQVIWDEKLAGKFIYASTTDKTELETVSGFKGKPGILSSSPTITGSRENCSRLLDPAHQRRA